MHFLISQNINEVGSGAPRCLISTARKTCITHQKVKQPKNVLTQKAKLRKHTTDKMPLSERVLHQFVSNLRQIEAVVSYYQTWHGMKIPSFPMGNHHGWAGGQRLLPTPHRGTRLWSSLHLLCSITAPLFAFFCSFSALVTCYFGESRT